MTDSDDRQIPANRRAYDLRDTEYYMPAMWPMDLQNAIVDWLSAWRWRRQMRKLLQQDAQGLVRLGSTQATVAQGAGESLKVIAARKSRLRRERAKP
ncbi:hypothetical protein [Pseudomonas sp. EA_35y_Pfl2_R111]|uniref:hypothetical protein n=1 Tax=Pseudomonas sp. EA_35y_Pfl2_R111 TaxID=3088689 RepID=UPI0030DBA480